MSYSREDYFAEGLGESLEEHGVVATSEQIKAIARDVVLFAENIGQAFYSPEDPGHVNPTRFARNLRRSGRRLFAGYVKAPVTPYRTARTILPTPPAGSAMGPGGMRHECQA